MNPTATDTPLSDLIGPLTFATRDGTAIERIGGLPDLVRAKVAAWREALDPEDPGRGRADRWLKALATYDRLDADGRRDCLKVVLGDIQGGAPSRTRKKGSSEKRRSPVPEAIGLLTLGADVRFLPGVGERRAMLLEKLGIRTVEDLLLHLPSRYEDRSRILTVSELTPGRMATVRGEVIDAELKTTRNRRMRIFDAVLTDDSLLGGVVVARWFNQPHKARQVRAGEKYLLSGKVIFDRFLNVPVLENPECEPWEDGEETVHTGRVVAIYPATEGLTSRQLRTWVAAAITAVPDEDPMPQAVLKRLGLPARDEAFRTVHRPPQVAAVASATRRFAFEEFFHLQLGLGLKRRNQTRVRTGISFPDRPGALESRLRERLPFALTGAQERVLAEVFRDLSGDTPMHRLVQGDVGCGKTMVALFALVRAVDNGFQGAIMAPTEVLAAQHYQKISELLEALRIPVALLVGGQAKGRKTTLAAVADGTIPIVVGTQALIQDKVSFHRLGVAVVDEQHRFGVRQRALIGAKGKSPHVLAMTATPIPRSLAMTVYGDLDLSVIDELPPGRSPVKTRLYGEKRREQVYKKIRVEVEKGRRAYVVHPLVEDSEKSDLRAATVAMEELRNGDLSGLQLALLHGRMRSDEKTAVMADFAAGRIQVLVTTTVVEVGVDVAEATVMVVEHAERFGLSQLHQLRGRVGRGKWPGECLLVASPAVSRDGRERLKALVDSNDGFVIAERDLEIRGPGELFGRRQSGLPELKVANLITDAALLSSAREEAARLLDQDPVLSRPEHAALKRTVAERWKDHLSWGAVG
ncbi:MAG: ATP-dependent DNA helicase RecG [Nitrospirota bacterium]|nr:ATP-dependent DNA helicase RecG [Nitrospirota bacterium]